MYQSENKRLESESKSGLPYPYLQGFINEASANHPAKRVVFDYSGFDDLKSSLQNQIDLKAYHKEQTRLSEFQ